MESKAMMHEEELKEYLVHVEKLNMDFTLSRYKDLCAELLNSGYIPPDGLLLFQYRKASR